MDELSQITGNHTKVSGDQEQILALPDRLCSTADVELGEEVGRVGLDGIDRDEQFVGDLLVGEALRDEFEHFVFPFADAEFLKARGVELEIRDGDVDCFSFRELETDPGAHDREDQGENTGIKFNGEVAYEETVLEELED